MRKKNQWYRELQIVDQVNELNGIGGQVRWETKTDKDENPVESNQEETDREKR